MHQALRIGGLDATIIILAESPETVLKPRDPKDQGYGALISIGLILIAIVITILVFLRKSRSESERAWPAVDPAREDRTEPEDDDLTKR